MHRTARTATAHERFLIFRCYGVQSFGEREWKAAARAYSSSKVIHRWRGGAFFISPQPAVSNFGGGAKMGCKKLWLSLNQMVEHAGSGRRIPRSNARRFKGDFRSETLRLVAKEHSEPFACKCKTLQRRTSISASVRQGLRARHNENTPKKNYE